MSVIGFRSDITPQGTGECLVKDPKGNDRSQKGFRREELNENHETMSFDSVKPKNKSSNSLGTRRVVVTGSAACDQRVVEGSLPPKDSCLVNPPPYGMVSWNNDVNGETNLSTHDPLHKADEAHRKCGTGNAVINSEDCPSSIVGGKHVAGMERTAVLREKDRNNGQYKGDKVTCHERSSLFKLASVAYANGEFTRAVELCQELCSKQINHADVLLLLGASLYQLGDYKGCMKANDAAILLNPALPEAHCNLANALQQLGSLDLAILYYTSALRLRPTFADAYANLASAYLQKGESTNALQAYATALTIDPSQNLVRCSLADLWRNQGTEAGRVTAVRLFNEALEKNRKCSAAWRGLGDCARESGFYEKAIQYYQKSIESSSTCVEGYIGLGMAYKDQKRLSEAEKAFAEAVKLRPACAISLGNLAGTQFDLGKLSNAIHTFRKALEICPNSPELLNNFGNALREAGHLDESLRMYVTAIQVQLSSLAQLPSSIQPSSPIFSGFAFSAALTNTFTPGPPSGPANFQANTTAAMLLQPAPAGQINPNSMLGVGTASPAALQLMQRLSVSYTNLAGVLKLLGRNLEAVAAYEHVVSLQPLVAEAHANLAAAYKDVSRHEEAISSYMKSLSLRPDFPEATANLAHSLQCVCDWRQYGPLFVNLEAQVRKDLDADRLPAVQPFHAMAYPFSAELALKISQKYADTCLKSALRLPGSPSNGEKLHREAMPLSHGTRLRIGYVSSDFGNHPLSHLMGSVFGLHDRSTVDVFCYALSSDDGTEWRKRIKSEAEHFRDVSQLTADQIAHQIAADGIHIAINLNGYTKGARNEIFALCPAPVQVSFMGFPATMGAKYIPWIVLDKTVCPKSSRHCYSENVAFMPHSYFVNDYRHSHREVIDGSSRIPSRKDIGLPEDAIVFSCANQLYKLDPDTFAIWCRILLRVPGSVLWLLRFPPSGEMRVKAEASLRGVDPARIVFTDVASKPIHVARSGLADVFLDTPRCNAHTTGCDVLWGGCPIVTLPLERMASRVAASLCNATGLGEYMIASSPQDYEDRAVELGLNRQKREHLREMLRKARDSCPLFDTPRWVKNFERLLLTMWDTECKKLGPKDFEVQDIYEQK